MVTTAPWRPTGSARSAPTRLCGLIGDDHSGTELVPCFYRNPP